MRQQYHDGIAIVRAYSKPDLFITMTCNPQWPEITRELLPHQTAQDRPDLVTYWDAHIGMHAEIHTERHAGRHTMDPETRAETHTGHLLRCILGYILGCTLGRL